MPESAPETSTSAIRERAVKVTSLSGVNSNGVSELGRDFTAECEPVDENDPSSYSGRFGRQELEFPTPVTAGFLQADGLPYWRGPVNKEEFDRILANVGDSADFILRKLNGILEESNGRD